MFIKNYLSDINYMLLIDKYYEEYIESIDKNNFITIYQLFNRYHFYFIEDIIVSYLEIFTMNVSYVESRILLLKEKLGDNFVYIIGNDMSFLDFITNEE